MDQKAATLKEAMAYFGMSIGEFSKEWKKMPTPDRAQILAGIGDGTLTY